MSTIENVSISETHQFIDSLNLPGFPGYKKEIEKRKETQKDILSKIILSKRIHLGAKKICLKCFTPIYDNGECPNCE